MQMLRNGLGSVFLLLCLVGCATPCIATSAQVIRKHPPAVLMAPCVIPAYHGDTNADLLDWALSLRAELTSCNADKTALRQWRANETKE